MSSVAGEMDGSCEKCGHPYAQPHRPIENPKGGGPGTSEVVTTGKAQAKYNSSQMGKTGAEKSAASMPGKPEGTNSVAGAGGGSSKRGAKTATEKPEDAIWQPSATWEMSASDEPDEEY